MPDDWLHRASELSPIRVVNQNLELPGHVRLRLEELFRSYIFGAFISVLALSRSILEYAILDNLHKFRLEAKWPPDRDGRQREKKLSHLIDELGELLPELLPRLEHLRDLGNEYIHPKKTQTSKASLLQRRENLRAAVRLAHELVQSFFIATRGKPDRLLNSNAPRRYVHVRVPPRRSLNIFIAGGSGAIGRQRVPMFVQQAQRVVAMASTPVIGDVLDGDPQRLYPM